MALPRNPASNEALRVNELELGSMVQIVTDAGKLSLFGVVRSRPDYDGDEWHGLAIDCGKKNIYKDPYTLGLICSRDGVWSSNFVLPIKEA